MKRSKIILYLIILSFIFMTINPAIANENSPKSGKISGKTVAGCALSFFIWPGIGQAINDDSGHKVLTHAVLGIVPFYRFWSGYDALVDRKGGYWKGRI
ncbi:MAG: hypothetical protein WCK67_08305 [bacterium]